MTNDLLVDIENFLISNSIAITDGVDIFRDFVPPEPENVIVISEYAGIPIPLCSVRSLQVKVRNTSNSNAKQKAWDIYNLLNSQEDIVQFTPERWAVLNLRQTPFKVDSTQTTVTWCFNIGVTTYNDN